MGEKRVSLDVETGKGKEERETHPELPQPLLPVVRLLLVERKIDEISITLLGNVELKHVLGHVAEVLLRVGGGARSQSLRSRRRNEESATGSSISRSSER